MDCVDKEVDREVYCSDVVFVRSKAPRPTWRRAIMSWSVGDSAWVGMCGVAHQVSVLSASHLPLRIYKFEGLGEDGRLPSKFL